MNISIRQPQDLEQLKDHIRQERNAKQRDRYRAVLLALDGRLTSTIMQMLGRSKNFVQRWSYAYRDGGIEAIAPGRPTGRPPKLTPLQEQQFRQRMLDGPRQEDDVCTLRAKDARHIIEEELGVQYSLAGVYDLLHRLGLSCLQPRPKHRKNDLEAMKEWLEKAPLLSKKPRKNNQARP